MPLTVLIVEEDTRNREAWTERLRGAGHRVFAFGTAASATASLGDVPVDLAFLAFGDGQNHRELQARLKDRHPACQVILLADRPAGEREVALLEAGARQILLRPAGVQEIEDLARRVNDRRRRRNDRPEPGGADILLGESPALTDVRDMIRKVATARDTSVLITGESGTGKELVARALHAESPRADGPFLEINCAAIPEALLESELFGHEAGAFTDATREKPGLVELAEGGTLFLDEIGEMAHGLQAKLLRFLDSRRIRRVAGRETIQVDVRILAATNRDLAGEVQGRQFRHDLYHRLNVVHIHLPPLRERGDDLVLLVRHFVTQTARKLGHAAPRIDPGLLERLKGCSWPGNVRELANAIERAVLLAGDRDLTPEDFPSLPVSGRSGGLSALISAGQVEIDFTRGPVPLEIIEREAIQAALRASHGNVSEAARLLGLGRGALRYKIDRLHLGQEPLAA